MTTTIQLDKTDAKLLQAALNRFFDCNEKKILNNEDLKDSYIYLKDRLEWAIAELEEEQ